MAQQDVASIARHFEVDGRVAEVQAITRGHINDTYVVTAEGDNRRARYVLQRINHFVFRDPPAVMRNIVRVTEHIRGRMEAIDPHLAGQQLRVIRSDDGQGYYGDAEGNFWRMYNFIEGAISYDTVESTEITYEAARMFGWFLRMLTDLPGPALIETIPDFHNTPKRVKTFEQVLKEDVRNRASSAKAEIAFLLANAGFCDVLLNLAEKGEIAVRATHNDTKVNNVMLDATTNKGVCVVDLDTVMPGLSLYDFGDLVRTTATSAAEDERDLSKVAIRADKFEVLVRGFAEQTRGFLGAEERKHLVFGAKVICFEQFVRFLGDYLAGDLYYKVSCEEHNLDRARTQMKLVESIIKQEEDMNHVVEQVFRGIE